MLLDIDGYNVHIEINEDNTISLKIYNGFNSVSVTMTAAQGAYIGAYLDVLATFIKKQKGENE